VGDTNVLPFLQSPGHSSQRKDALEKLPELGANAVGCRVAQKSQLDVALKASAEGYSPSYKDLLKKISGDWLGTPSSAGCRLEDFATDLMMTCKAGLVDESPNFESLLILMNQKQRPMSCAISITFDTE